MKVLLCLIHLSTGLRNHLEQLAGLLADICNLVTALSESVLLRNQLVHCNVEFPDKLLEFVGRARVASVLILALHGESLINQCSRRLKRRRVGLDRLGAELSPGELDFVVARSNDVICVQQKACKIQGLLNMLLSLITDDIFVCLALRTHDDKQNYEDDNGKQKEGSHCTDGDGQ